MRAAHSLKGAARLVDIDTGVALAHALEDCFVAAQNGRTTLGQREIDRLLRGVDLLLSIAKSPDLEMGRAAAGNTAEIDSFVADLATLLEDGQTESPPAVSLSAPAEERVPVSPAPQQPAPPADDRDLADRVLRVTVDNLNRLLGLAGELLWNPGG